MIVNNINYDRYLLRDMDAIKKRLDKKDDMVLIVDGAEGSGKSTLAMQMASYLDPNFNLSKVCFVDTEFISAVDKGVKGDCIIFDESYLALNNRSVLSTSNKRLVGLLTEVRRKSLILIFCIPSFFDMDKYLALWRSKLLIHVYKSNGKKGFYAVYSPKLKKRLFIEGKQYYNYNVKPFYRARFGMALPFSEADYDNKKAESFKRYANSDKKDSKVDVLKPIFCSVYAYKGLSNQEKSKILGVAPKTFYAWKKKYIISTDIEGDA